MINGVDPTPQITVSLDTGNTLICQSPESIIGFLEDNPEAAKALYQKAIIQLREFLIKNQDFPKGTCLYYDQTMPEVSLKEIHTDIIALLFSSQVGINDTTCSAENITNKFSEVAFHIISGRGKIMQDSNKLLLEALSAFCKEGTHTDIYSVLQVSEHKILTDQQREELDEEVTKLAKKFKNYERIDEVENELSDTAEPLRTQTLLKFVSENISHSDKNDVLNVLREAAKVPDSNVGGTTIHAIKEGIISNEDVFEIIEIAANVPGSRVGNILSIAIKRGIISKQDKEYFMTILRTASNIPGGEIGYALGTALEKGVLSKKDKEFYIEIVTIIAKVLGNKAHYSINVAREARLISEDKEGGLHRLVPGWNS